MHVASGNPRFGYGIDDFFAPIDTISAAPYLRISRPVCCNIDDHASARIQFDTDKRLRQICQSALSRGDDDDVRGQIFFRTRHCALVFRTRYA